MVFLRTVVRSIALVGLGSACLQAQSAHARVVVAPQGRPRIASIAPPPPAPALFTYGQTIFENYPVIVTSDGRVLIDLGYGYEQVARTCPYAYGYGCQSYGYPIAPQTPVFQNINPPSQYVPPRYAPPAYGAPYYPTPTYPSGGGYGSYPGGGEYYYPPTYQPPTATGCPPGYVPTGSYPPCVDPSLTPASSAAIPGAVHAAPPRRPPAGTVLLPRTRR